VRIHHMVMADSIEERILAATESALKERGAEDELAVEEVGLGYSRGGRGAAQEKHSMRVSDLVTLFE
jgi:hypothetical protein